MIILFGNIIGVYSDSNSQIIKNPSLENFGYLGADIGFALVPFVPNVKRIGEAGKLVKGLDNVGDVSDAANAIFIT